MFVSDQRGFYSSYKELLSSCGLPNGSDIINFWSTLWSDTTPDNAKASWLPTIDLALHNLHAQECLTVTSRWLLVLLKGLIIGSHLAQIVSIIFG